MIVTLDLKKGNCTVVKDESDPKFYMSERASAESTFLYHVLQALQDDGYDVIKKRMWTDGHLVDDLQQYIRSRNVKSKNAFCVFNGHYQIEDAGLEFNKLIEGSRYYLNVYLLN